MGYRILIKPVERGTTDMISQTKINMKNNGNRSLKRGLLCKRRKGEV